MASKLSKSPSSPKAKQPVSKRGTPSHTMNVPGYSRECGTPGYISKPAAAAAKKSK